MVYLLLIVVNMRLIELLVRWLYIRRKKQEMDFNYRTNLMIMYGKTPMYTYEELPKDRGFLQGMGFKAKNITEKSREAMKKIE